MSFPTTPILDNFTRANENPLSDGGNWSSSIVVNDVGLKLVSDYAVGTMSANPNSSYWSAAIFHYSEAYITWSAVPVAQYTVVLSARTSNENTSGPNTTNGYFFTAQPAQAIYFSKFVNGTFTVLSNDTSQANLFVSGDTQGFSVIKNQLAGFREHGGTWSEIGVVTDNALTSGHIGISLGTNSTMQLSNFGGGEAPSASATNFLVPYMGVIPATLGTTTVKIG